MRKWNLFNANFATASYSLFFTACFLVEIGKLEGQEIKTEQEGQKVIDSIDQVELLESPHLNPEGHLIGEEYFVRNNNPYPVYVKIHLTKEVNVKNELTTMTKTVPSGQEIGLGNVWKDKQANATWDYDWIMSRSPL